MEKNNEKRAGIPWKEKTVGQKIGTIIVFVGAISVVYFFGEMILKVAMGRGKEQPSVVGVIALLVAFICILFLCLSVYLPQIPRYLSMGRVWGIMAFIFFSVGRVIFHSFGNYLSVFGGICLVIAISLAFKGKWK